MKTIAQTLQDSVGYPLNMGMIENILIGRGLSAEHEITTDVYNCNPFKGALADCLYALITVPNISESDMSISLSDKELILKRANALYDSIGEEGKTILTPKVYIGG